MDREQRRMRARLEARRERGLGPAIAVQKAAAVLGLAFGGLFVLNGIHDIASGGEYALINLKVTLVALAYTAIAGGQAMAAFSLARRQVEARAGTIDDAIMARAVAIALAVTAAHVLLPICYAGYETWDQYQSWSAGGIGPGAAALTGMIAGAAVFLLPFVGFPIAALILTLRAWRRVAGDTEQTVVDADGNITRLDPATVRRTRWAVEVGRAAAIQLMPAAPVLLCTGNAALMWGLSGARSLSGSDEVSAAIAITMLMAVAVVQAITATMLLVRRRERDVLDSFTWLAAGRISLAHVIATAFALFLLVLGSAGASGPGAVVGLAVTIAICEVLPVLAWNTLRRTDLRIRAEQDRAVSTAVPVG